MLLNKDVMFTFAFRRKFKGCKVITLVQNCTMPSFISCGIAFVSVCPSAFAAPFSSAINYSFVVISLYCLSCHIPPSFTLILAGQPFHRSSHVSVRVVFGHKLSLCITHRFSTAFQPLQGRKLIRFKHDPWPHTMAPNALVYVQDCVPVQKWMWERCLCCS